MGLSFCKSLLKCLGVYDMLKNKNHLGGIASIGLALAYFWGGVSTQRYYPDALNLYVGLFVAFIALTGLSIYFFKQKITQIPLSAVLWWGLMFLILLQPTINGSLYSDALIFPAGAMLVCGLIAVFVAQLDDIQKQTAVKIMAYSIIAVGIATVVTQMLQMTRNVSLSPWVLFTAGDRVAGNIGQVNQAAFVLAMAMTCIPYILYTKRLKKWHYIVLFLVMLFFALGIGFTASRGGLILSTVALLSAGIFYKAPWQKRMLCALMFFPILWVGYVSGTYIMNEFMQSSLSGVGRIMGENTVHRRISLLEWAWQAFSSDWITGVGWGRYMEYGLVNYETIPWVTAALHSHNIIAQIAAELGLLGLVLLLGFIAILLKNLRFDLEPHKALAYAILASITLYSLSEFPLWFMNFLLLTSFMVAILDDRLIVIKFSTGKIHSAISVIVMIMSVFYIYNYLPYKNLSHSLERKDIPYIAKIEAYDNLPRIYGYNIYRDMLYFMLVPMDGDLFEQKAQLGDKVIYSYPSPEILEKQAYFLVRIGKADKAKDLYKMACIWDYAEDFYDKYCKDVKKNLQQMENKYPELYKGYTRDLEQWQNDKGIK